MEFKRNAKNEHIPDINLPPEANFPNKYIEILIL